MANIRWVWLLNSDSPEDVALEASDIIPVPATASFGEGGYPALFTLTESLGFFAVGPGKGLLYYFDRQRNTVFLFPDTAD